MARSSLSLDDGGGFSVSDGLRAAGSACGSGFASTKVRGWHHLLVTLDAVLRYYAHAVLLLVLLGRRPGEVVAADLDDVVLVICLGDTRILCSKRTYLDIIVGKLAVLVVVHAEQLGLGACAQVQARDEVDGLGDDGGHDKGVGGAGDDEGDLDVQLLAVVVEEPPVAPVLTPSRPIM